MALTESIEYDKIEVVGQYKAVQVRKATVIKRDGVEVTVLLAVQDQAHIAFFLIASFIH